MILIYEFHIKLNDKSSALYAMSRMTGELSMTISGIIDASENLAQAVLEQRLAACVNIGGSVKSLYHWKGQVETAVTLSDGLVNIAILDDHNKVIKELVFSSGKVVISM